MSSNASDQRDAMSGGYWHYEHDTFRDAAWQRRDEAKSIADGRDYSAADALLVQRAMECVADLLQAAGDIEKEVDWRLSGDTGPDELRRNLRALHRTHRDAIRIALLSLHKAAWDDESSEAVVP
jgi:hypothetical protein